MKRKKLVFLFIFIVLLALSLAGAFLLFRANQKDSRSPTESLIEKEDNIYALEDVAANDGISGRKCWVVVDNVVYEISGFVRWVDGLHTSSDGKARCGRDLSEVIKQAPHGKSKLKLLQEVGRLK